MAEPVPIGESASALDEILARLVAAGVEQPSALGLLLGVDDALNGRSLRALLRVGIVAADANGALHVTPRGEAWLRLPATPEPIAGTNVVLDLPALKPLPAALEPVSEPKPKTPRTQTWLKFRPHLPALRLPGPAVPRLVVHRRVAVVGASALLVVVAGEAGFYSFDRTPAGLEPAAPALATPLPVVITEVPTPSPAPTPEHWMVVQHTNGLGLVLRPAPASAARVLLLSEGARLRVTGGSVQQAGHAWLPVTSTNGSSGWVAGEFLAPER